MYMGSGLGCGLRLLLRLLALPNNSALFQWRGTRGRIGWFVRIELLDDDLFVISTG